MFSKIHLYVTLLASSFVSSHVHLFTIIDPAVEGYNWKLRELSIHASPKVPNAFYVYAYAEQLDPLLIDEIKLWHKVEFIDISSTITHEPVGRSNTAFSFTEWIRLSIFERVSRNFKEIYEKAVFIKLGYLFDEGILEALPSMCDGYEMASEDFVETSLNDFRGIQSTIKTGMKEDSCVSLQKAQVETRLFCSIRARKELVFASLLFRREKHMLKPKTLALLVPTYNEAASTLGTCSLTRHLLPSLEKTLTETELTEWTITVYIGYDAGDGVFDVQDSFKLQIVGFFQRRFKNFTVKLIMLPKSNWITFIWNRLFVEAYSDGQEYFLQVNDDVQLLSPGWLTSASKLMKGLSDVGVVGLNDTLWNCSLFTQAFLSRSHYKIFRGQMFPLELRNWYSDDWISRVYGPERSVCAGSALIRNGQASTRYVACDDRNLKEALEQGQSNLNAMTLRIGTG